jgi:hypothetical protein
MKEEIKLTFEQAEQIEAILLEASAYGLAWEISELAGTYIETGDINDPIEAYQAAFHEWIK